MWTYIYYSIYLDTIDVSDHNAIEKFVYEMVSACCVGSGEHEMLYTTSDILSEMHNYI